MDHGWQLHTVRELQACRKPRSPLLEYWDDLEARERALGIQAGQPFLLSPSGRPDIDVVKYLNSGTFRRLANQSQRSYAIDLKVYLNFLFSQGKDWRKATEEDFLNFEFWRRRDPRNPKKISGAKFSRELAALSKFYNWQVERGILDRSPIRSKEILRHSGRIETTLALSPTNIRRSNVKWLTPRAYRRWRDIGLAGYSSNGARDCKWRGRNDGRNIAFSDTLWSSGLRLTEGATLLILELPHTTELDRYLRGRIGEAVAKGGAKRDFWISRQALEKINNYIEIDRQAAIERANYEGRYNEISGIIIVEKVNRKRELICRNEKGARSTVSLDELDQGMRAKLFSEINGVLEPASLWLTESGMPMPPSTWEVIFQTANQRCTLQGVPIYCHPHMLRHSFALKMLVTLIHAFDRRMGLSAEERREFRMLFGDPWVLVQTMLGHRSTETTRDIYLEPVTGLQVDLFLNDHADDEAPVNSLLSRIAEMSNRVKDICP